MRALNFSIDSDYISLNFEVENIDLHNNYDFVSFTHDEMNKKATCIFHKSQGHWVPVNAMNRVTLLFENVTAVFHKSHYEDYPGEYIENDGKSVDMIGYSYDTDAIMEGVTSNVSSTELPALLITFVNGKAIKIVADSVEISINNSYN